MKKSMLRSFFGTVLAATLMAFYPATSLADARPAGNETRSGGSVVRTPSGRLRLADFYFEREGQARVRVGQDLVNTIRRAIDWVDYELRLDKLDSLKSAIFGPHSEYIFVEKLPVDCGFLDHTEINERHGDLEPIGCTLGYLTYIVPNKFVELPLEDQALFIVHERLHNVAPKTSYDVKVDVVRAMNLYLEKIYPAKVKAFIETALGKNDLPKEILSDKEIEVLNKLPLRISQLNFVGSHQPKLFTSLSFTRSGSVVTFSPIKPQNTTHWEMAQLSVDCRDCSLAPSQQLRLYLPQYGGEIRATLKSAKLSIDTNMNRDEEQGAFYTLVDSVDTYDKQLLKQLWVGFCVGVELLSFEMAEPIAALPTRAKFPSPHAACFE